ncbi:ubiquitin carboxy terminal hydrolase Ubp1 [Schizosaccharomyces cryophilus OY26]|uniref:Ubiquitin carboxy terminal hydrolase Ubp1 n=1 Tax=Schizosaccharomyces cryophilus (strain OY26 / ATCC MYA-4695 / CBS 11777 / NBRC 106824 / NRRL Y48691) TaxID=653667 RepID=S9VUE2_SCHCR|nr:ubiquitin carboxy terminal hydrolase Ubp1 [Schizosaccharomyces cryophilus OY26]EPY49789.1 ubiquitin carboxy terminal hydrolase Ubp1 [Schizosaccharomyces cryophilus OY26]
MASTAAHIGELQHSANWRDIFCETLVKDFVSTLEGDLDKWKTDDSAYLIEYEWFEAYKDFLSGKSHLPGPIEQRKLLDKNHQLLPGLEESIDYTIISSSAWQKLAQWFGVHGFAIERKVIRTGPEHNLQPFVNVYPISFSTVFIYADSINRELSFLPPTLHYEGPYKFHFSRSHTLKDLFQFVRTNFHILKSLKYRIWYNERLLPSNRFLPISYARSLKGTILLNDFADCMTMFEMNMEKGCLIIETLNAQFQGWLMDSPQTVDTKSMVERGYCGINNIGNTCYMNSALQCLFHTYELSEYFIQDRYKGEINSTNPLGMKGKVALAYANLLKQANNNGVSGPSLSPFTLKYIVSEFNSSFAGYSQNDSQEFIAFFLDGLHEDLNRVINKPYFERPDLYSENPVQVQKVADECWETYSKRNDSIIVELFQGMYKSTLQCSTCCLKSVVFDPFMYLTLPLPKLPKWRHTVNFVPISDHDSPEKFDIKIPSDYTVQEAKCYAVMRLQQFGYSTESVKAVDIYDGKVYKCLNEHEKISKIIHSYDRLFMYETTKEKIITPIVHCKSRPQLPGSFQRCDPFGYPLQLSFSQNYISKEELYRRVRKLYHKYADIIVTPDMFQICVQNVPPGVDVWNRLKEFESYEYTPVSEEGVLLNNQTIIMCVWKEDSQKKAFIKNEWIFEGQQYHLSSITLDDCLEEFSRPEQLSLEDSWYCPSCKDFRAATKQMEIWKLPRNLIIHLNRFSCTNRMRKLRKRKDYVLFPTMNLDMQAHISPLRNLKEKEAKKRSYTYDLYAVDNHHGYMINSHYTSYAKDALTGKFLNYDDAYVRSVGDDSIVTSAAYVLFYQEKK